MIGPGEIGALCPLHGAILTPANGLPKRIPGCLALASPDQSFHVMAKENFWAARIPGDHPGRENEVADDHIVALRLKMLPEAPCHFWLAKLSDGVVMRRKQAPEIRNGFGKASPRGQPERPAHYPSEQALQLGMGVIGMFGVEGKKCDVVPTGQLLQDVIAANSATQVEGDKAPSLNPQDFHQSSTYQQIPS